MKIKKLSSIPTPKSKEVFNMWVDFKAVKEAAPITAVLSHYGIDWLKKQPGGELRGRCPIHGEKGSGGSFHANTSKNNFQCFVPSCGAHGNVLDFVAAMEKCSVRDAALKLQDWFQVAGNAGAGKQAHKEDSAGQGTGAQLAAEKRGERGEPV